MASILQYELPLYDLETITLSDNHLSFSKKDGFEILANSDYYTFDVSDLRKLFIYSPTKLTGISEKKAKDLFLQWCHDYKGVLWSPIHNMARQFQERYSIQLVSSKQNHTYCLKNLSHNSKCLETGDKIYAIPPLLSIVRESNHIFKINNKEQDIFLQPMLFNEKDYDDLKFDLVMSIMQPHIELKTIGKSFLKNKLSASELITLTDCLSYLKPVGTVFGPVTANPNGSIMGLIGSENKIHPCQRFHIKFRC